MKLADFNTRHPERPPRRPHRNADEVRRLAPTDGVMELGVPPAVATERRRPQKQGDDGCHLWVFEAARIPYVLERAAVARSLTSGVVKHSNLTGGEKASSGGELWVDPDDACLLYINGCSGRYGPESERQLQDTVEVFEQLGFSVRSFGWDEDVNLPAKVLR